MTKTRSNYRANLRDACTRFLSRADTCWTRKRRARCDCQPTGTVSASTSSGFKSVPFSTLQPPNRARKPKVITLDDLVATRWSWASGLSIISVSQVAFCVN